MTKMSIITIIDKKEPNTVIQQVNKNQLNVVCP